ncbi:MAG: ABC transporter permease [Melioribacteraceae bacterium]
MKKILTIAKWELMERIKRKSFIISMIVMPLLVIGFSLLPSMLISDIKDSPLPIGIIDFTNKYSKEVIKEISYNILRDGQPAFLVLNFANKNKDKSDLLNTVDAQVLSNGIAGYIIIDKNDDGINLAFRTNKILDVEKVLLIEKAFNKVILRNNLQISGLAPKDVSIISNNHIPLNRVFIDGASEEDIFKSFITSYLFIILLITMTLFSGGMFVRSLVVEKSNRIIEIILSSCTSKELLLGKVFGLSFFGLFQFIIWTILGLVLYKTNTVDFSTIQNLQYQILFFVLGYILYSSIFIGLGSVVTVDHEAQQLTGYLSIFLIFPILFAFQIISSPNSFLALAMSYFPLTAAPVMLLRLNATTPSVMEIITVVLILVFSLYVVIFISSKLFRIGILNTGKRPTMKEIVSWLKVK